MVENGTRRVYSVDASPAYIAAARSEAERRGYVDDTTYVEGDFVDNVDVVPDVDVVTLDRVVCCYPDVDALLGSAASKAQSAIGLVFPRDETIVRLAVRIGNCALRVFGSDFQAFVHPHLKIEQILVENGFQRVRSDKDLIWTTALYARNQPE
jgi:magnesium-protoporphyrin O-methyltransferase